MPCCGDKRQRLGSTSADANGKSRGAGENTRPTDTTTVPQHETVRIQYTGRTGLTVLGPISRRRYRFNQPNEILEVDRRDAPSLAAVPHLRWLNREKQLRSS